MEFFHGLVLNIYRISICNIAIHVIHIYVTVGREQGVRTKEHLEGNLSNADYFFSSIYIIFFFGVHADV